MGEGGECVRACVRVCVRACVRESVSYSGLSAYLLPHCSTH